MHSAYNLLSSLFRSHELRSSSVGLEGQTSVRAAPEQGAHIEVGPLSPMVVGACLSAEFAPLFPVPYLFQSRFGSIFQIFPAMVKHQNSHHIVAEEWSDWDPLI